MWNISSLLTKNKKPITRKKNFAQKYRASVCSQSDRKQISLVVAVTDDVGAVRHVGKDRLRLVQRQRAPVPALVGEVDELGRQNL